MKVLLVDDHALFREGLLLVLESLDIEIESFEAGSYESAEKMMLAHPDLELVLLDLGLPGISYLDALQAMRARLPDALIVILSGTEDHHVVEMALQNGARGYIPKSSSAKIMLNALQLVLAGDTYIPTQILQKNTSPTSGSMSNPVNTETSHKLTPRQYEVLQQLATGKSNKEIGNELNLTESTVRAHVAAILKTFNVANRTHAVQYAIQNNWLSI